MKKLSVVIAIVAVMSVIAADPYVFPGWNKDASVYAADIARYEAAPEDQKPFDLVTYNKLRLAYALAGKTIDSFNVIYAAAREIWPGNDKFAGNYACSRAIAAYNADYKSQVAISILRGAYDFSRQNKFHYSGYIVTSPVKRKAIGVSDNEAVAALLEALDIVECPRYKDIAVMLDTLYDLLPDCDMPEADQLAALKRFNRRFSKELLGKNKDKWEQIIAKLRTVIASY